MKFEFPGLDGPIAPDTPFLKRVQMALPHLHPAERRLGEFLFEFPGEIASYDAQELARLAKVSKATVSRFVRRLGFENYDHARKLVREESQTGSRLFLGHAAPESAEAALDLSMSEERENLEWTFRRIDPRELDALAEAIVSSRKVWLIGQRLSHSFASYLAWQLTKVAPDITAAPAAGETLGEYVVGMRPEDCVIFFALRRVAAGTQAAIDACAATGARVALISDQSLSHRDDLAWHFICQTKTATPQFNHVAVIALCHQIMVRATLAGGAQARERLRRIDEINEKLGAV